MLLSLMSQGLGEWTRSTSMCPTTLRRADNLRSCLQACPCCYGYPRQRQSCTTANTAASSSCLSARPLHFQHFGNTQTCNTRDRDKNNMPIVKYPRTVDPLWYEWDRKAQKCGLRHTVYAVNGDRYTGEWLDNLKHGKGTQTWKKTGAIYSGDWKFGKRDGYGTYSLPDPVTKEYKKVYAGWWKNDKKCGYGIKFYSDVEYYEGEWNGGKRDGWGRMYYKDGSIYEGQWAEDKPGGQGMFRLKNENRYEGYWKDGKKHGPGKFFYLDSGQLFEGFWVADIAKCGTMIDFGRDEAPLPTQYPIPKIELADPEGVLEDAVMTLENAEDVDSQLCKER